MFDRDTVADLIAQVRTYDLERPVSFDLASLEQIQEAYNGIGPDWLPENLREWLTARYGYFAAGALVHDWEYQTATDKSREAFIRCNERLRRNCRKLLRKGYPWYKAFLYRERPNILADACNRFGWEAWKEA